MATEAPKRIEGPPSFWEREAADVLRDVIWRRRFSQKDLSRALESYGIKLAHTTLSNKIARGKFSFAFFIQCMYAMSLNDVRVPLRGMSDVQLEEVRAVAAAKHKRKPPQRKVKATGTTSSARNPRR